jgi:hypothetical protein
MADQRSDSRETNVALSTPSANRAQEMTMTKYVASRGGHAPGHLRAMFLAFVETGEVPVEELLDPSLIADRDPVNWLCGQLWNCTDQMPAWVRSEPGGTVYTYAQAARLVRPQRAA